MNVSLPIPETTPEVSTFPKLASPYPHIDFIHETARMRYITRGWEEIVGLPPGFAANNAEHGFSATCIGVLLGAMEGLAEQEIHRIAFGLLFHDTPELRTRDHTPTSKKYVKTSEMKALKDILLNAPVLLRRLALKAFKNYKARETLVDRIIKSADILDSVREVIEWKAKGVTYIDRIPDRMEQKRERLVELGVPSALQVYDDLMAAGSEYVWNHSIHGKSTFADNQYGK